MNFPAKTAFWRRTPPAVFPPIMGLLGLGLAWRRAAEELAVSPAIADLVLGAATTIFLFLFAAHMAKFLARPETVIEDLRVLPGRTGLAAASLCVLLLAAVAVPYSERLAVFLLTTGLLWHIVLAALMVRGFFAAPREQRKATPAWHLSFVGFIVAPLASAPLGMVGLTNAIFVATLVISGTIYAISAAQLWQRSPPAPLRPLLAIHLAPLSLLGTACVVLGHITLALIFAGLASLMFAALLARVRYLVAAGFSPLWGAFTFPLAAYAGLLLALADYGVVFRFTGGAALVAASLIIPPIALQVLRQWARGTLAAATNAAVA